MQHTCNPITPYSQTLHKECSVKHMIVVHCVLCHETIDESYQIELRRQEPCVPGFGEASWHLCVLLLSGAWLISEQMEHSSECQPYTDDAQCSTLVAWLLKE